MGREVFNNTNVKLHDVLSDNLTHSKKTQLIFTNIHAEPPFPQEYEPFNIYFKFKNIGYVDAEEFTIRMITGHLEDNSLGKDIEDQIVSSLKQGETKEVILQFNYGMCVGIYVEAYLDYFNQFLNEMDMVYCIRSYELKLFKGYFRSNDV